jgi:alanyl-tRNA synthetase
MTSAQIRKSFLDFFREKQHTVVPSSSLLPDAPNLLFTNAGMNQFVPIFLGHQKPPWKPPRVADTQKCIRAGGKHNDLEDVGLDTYHHTFFEMLGNWSFGNYFKKEAIEWAWELLVERWKFPPQRLYATVYKPGPDEPSEFDQEAHDHWARLFQEADLDPAAHVLNGGKADNFWMMGDTGPCGPCSEVHVDLTPDGDTRGALVNQGDPHCIEIWNLVFIQFNAQAVAPVDAGKMPAAATKMVALPQRHVDTGMGFERVTAIIQGTKNFTDFSGTISNYETDIFRPIFDELEKLSGKKYDSTLPGSALVSSAGEGVPPSRTSSEKSPSRRDTATNDRDGRATQIQIDVAFRVIADHIRALSFAIADGIIPSNEGRGYVLRRILRRAVRYGRALGFHRPFLTNPAAVVAVTMKEVFPELRAKLPLIDKILRREEESFNKTLDAGSKIFEEAVSAIEKLPLDLSDTAGPAEFHATKLLVGEPVVRKEEFGTFKRTADGRVQKTISGDVAFKLYDTYGFPLDLTELMARERGMTVDVAGFEKLMEEQRERARKSQKKQVISAIKFSGKLETRKVSGPDISETKFVGYDFLEAEAMVTEVLPEEDAVVLNQTPCYAEMGGQVGDRGLLHVPGHDRTEVGQLRVIDTQKYGDIVVHLTELVQGRAPEPGEAVRISVDVDRRKLIQGHHTVTHLLHWALHEIVSRDAAQKGSYVGPDKLTFDFSSAALTPQQKRDVETLVNEKIVENTPVSWTEIPYDEAKKRKEIQQFFGEKYGDVVRVVQIGGEPEKLNGYSMELCGGTHVRSTSEIGAFRIVKEEAIAAGTRRIEAVAGDSARVWAKEEAQRHQEKFETLSRKKPDLAPLPVFTDTVQTDEMLKQIDARAAHLEQLDVDVREWEKKHAKRAEADLRSRAAQIANDLALSKVGQKICVASVPDSDAKLLQAVADALKQKFDGPILLAGAKDGNVALVAIVPKELTAKFQANKIIQQLAPIVGGKGGGRPESAQGGGTDADKIGNLLGEAQRLLS